MATATGTPLPPFAALRLLSMQGSEAAMAPLLEFTHEQATAAGQGIAAVTAQWAAAVLNIGLGGYDEAAAAAGEVVAHAMAPFMTNFALPEIIEAAAYRGDGDTAVEGFARLTESTQPAATDWALGIEARRRALLLADPEASHREAIERLGRTKLRPELARAHLLYGEWLRREGRRDEARVQLRRGHEEFLDIGMEAFAARARRELARTGEKVQSALRRCAMSCPRKRNTSPGSPADGLSNREIAESL